MNDEIRRMRNEIESEHYQPRKNGPHVQRRKPKIDREKILEAMDYYAKEWKGEPRWKRSDKNLKGFLWLIEYQDGGSIDYIAWRYLETVGSVRNLVKQTRMRVINYLKIKEIENE